MGTSATDLGIPGFGGEQLRPGDGRYDEARAVFNGMIDRRPALIAVCGSTDDVVAAVKFARAQALPISVYGGGHSVTGAAVIDDGLMIDMRGMKAIAVDPDARTVRAEAGLNWGEFDAATQEHGLAVTGGRVPDTGIIGLALGSGSGWLERKLGFTCDNLIGAEMVTADGTVVKATATENADLFWALRGGGGNFGIVTAVYLQLHPIGPIVYGGMLAWPAFMAGDVVRFWRDFMTRRARRGGRGAGVHHRAAGRLRARARAWPPGRRLHRLLRGRPRRGRAGDGAAPRVRPARARPVRARSPTPRCRTSSPRRTRTGGATTGRPTSSPSCPTTRSTRWSRQATEPVSPFSPILLVAGRRCRVPRARRRDRVRRAHCAVQHALPLDVGGPGRRRARTSRTRGRSRRR